MAKDNSRDTGNSAVPKKKGRQSAVCANPLYPCAMTGAASALAGISDMGVIIHGSSGCYYYADMAVPDTLHSTFIVQDEVIFGSAERLTEIVESVSKLYNKIAVINTCVPSVMGEDIKEILADYDTICIDAPGFIGYFDEGWKLAVRELADSIPINNSNPNTNTNTDAPLTDLSKDSKGNIRVNIDGVCSMDPFHKGSLIEATRLLNLCGLKTAAVFCHDTYESITHPSPYSVSVNPDYNCADVMNRRLNADARNSTGSLLGLENVLRTFEELSDRLTETADAGIDIDISKIESECEETDEILTTEGDRYLRRHDPPRVAVYSTYAYTEFACDMIANYMDGEIVHAAARNNPPDSDLNGGENPYNIGGICTLHQIKEILSKKDFDLIIGSSFEHAAFPDSAFVGLTFPIRHRKMLYDRPVAGIQGALYLMDEISETLENGNKKSN
ncbi:nitrogenase component 1 [Methanomicrobium mobile]|uniref:nitrogenase component 1 n=1 Tax=Methanomicrobium mobile TaxID=2205 RepID=UPI000694778F|nr:nitrogenase component 1 [Methanomicrobium mobile]